MCKGPELGRLLDRVERDSGQYSNVIVCSPYIDEYMATRLGDLRKRLRKNDCAMQVITTSSSADMLNKIGASTWSAGDVVVRSDLHAKVYLAVARRARATEAIVTSANLTHAGTKRNVEFGFRVANSTTQGRDLIRQIQGFLSGMAA